MTPLADIMFQLLIFFMLSSSLAPYALIPLAAPTAPASQDTATPQQQGGTPDIVIWHVAAGEVRARGESLPLASLPEVIKALKLDGLDEILLFTTASATTQDLATVIEAVRVGEVARVRLIGRPGGG
ncbi:MAG: biopolymer transport protein ExbD [Paracoccaceae bacterium]|jgi:biopolymer transport protein ExbD